MKSRGKGPAKGGGGGGGSKGGAGGGAGREGNRGGGQGREGNRGGGQGGKPGGNPAGKAFKPRYGVTFSLPAKQAPKQGQNQAPRPGGKSSPAQAHKGGKGGGRPPAGPTPSKPELGRLLASYGVKLPQPTLDSLWLYHQFLRENNKDLDLTRLIGFETMAQRHYADCMILHGFMQGKWPSPLVDVGSGAGFPGIMIKLMSPKTRLILAEPRPRRVDFLERVIKELKLRDISVFPHKVTSRSFTEPMAGTITRAFETVEKTLPRLGGCLSVGGKAIFMKGPKVAEELTELKNDEYIVEKNHIYRIPNTTLDRALLVMERIKVSTQASASEDLGQDDDMGEFDPGDDRTP